MSFTILYCYVLFVGYQPDTDSEFGPEDRSPPPPVHTEDTSLPPLNLPEGTSALDVAHAHTFRHFQQGL